MFTVIDDEAPTVYTAGAIVTVTVTLLRQDMSTLFGDETAQEKHCFADVKVNKTEGAEGDVEETKEQVNYIFVFSANSFM